MSEKEINKFIEELFTSLFKAIFGMIKSLFWGIRKLKRKGNFIVFLVSFIFSIVTRIMRDTIFSIDSSIYIQYLVYYILFFMPIIVLMTIGSIQNAKQEKYNQMFASIGFKGKNGRFPYFVTSQKDDKKQILIFKSNIALQEWKKARERLETAFNCTILETQNSTNKNIVRLVTVPSEYKLSEFIMWNDNYISDEDGVITVGVSALKHILVNLNLSPHILAAGETGSGKSVILRCLLWQVIYKGCKVIMFDFKGGVEFGKRFEKYGDVVMDRERALIVLTELVEENQRRLELFRDQEVKNLYEYNQKTGQNLCRICLFCDEIAEMLDKKGIAKEEKELFEKIEGKLSTLARLSRAAGINLILGVQRPDANVLTGQIKNNVPVRICGPFADKSASEIVLGNTRAVDLPSDIKGRFLFKLGNETIEMQAYKFNDDMMHDIPRKPGEMLTQALTYDRELENQYQEVVESQGNKEYEFNYD